MNLFYVIFWLCLLRRRRTYTILHAGGKPAQTCQRMSQSVLACRSFKVKQYLSYDLKLVHSQSSQVTKLYLSQRTKNFEASARHKTCTNSKDVEITSNQRWVNVLTLNRRWLTLSVRWDVLLVMVYSFFFQLALVGYFLWLCLLLYIYTIKGSKKGLINWYIVLIRS